MEEKLKELLNIHGNLNAKHKRRLNILTKVVNCLNIPLDDLTKLRELNGESFTIIDLVLNDLSLPQIKSVLGMPVEVEIPQEEIYEAPEEIPLENPIEEVVKSLLKLNVPPQELLNHPQFKALLSFDASAIPELVKHLSSGKVFIFIALKKITEEDPVPKDKKGNIKEMISIWTQWAKENGLI